MRFKAMEQYLLKLGSGLRSEYGIRENYTFAEIETIHERMCKRKILKSKSDLFALANAASIFLSRKDFEKEQLLADYRDYYTDMRFCALTMLQPFNIYNAHDLISYKSPQSKLLKWLEQLWEALILLIGTLLHSIFNDQWYLIVPALVFFGLFCLLIHKKNKI